MPKHVALEKKCLVCSSNASAQEGNARYCKKHWNKRRDLYGKALRRFRCVRHRRGTDYEHYFVSHDYFEDLFGQFYVLRDNCGDFSVVFLLNREFNWQQKAFEMKGEDAAISLLDIALKLPDDVCNSWGGEIAAFAVHEVTDVEWTTNILLGL